MIERQSTSYTSTRPIDRTKSKNQGDKGGDEKQHSVLFDDCMCLRHGRRELFGGVEEEIHGGWKLDQEVEPEGESW